MARVREYRKDKVKTPTTVGSVLWAGFKWIAYVLMILCAFSFVFVFAWTFMNSFKTAIGYAEDTFFLPEVWDFDNYAKVLREMQYKSYGLFEMLGNSVILIALGVINAMVWPQFAGYAMARFEFPGRKIIEAAVYVAMIIPIIGTTSTVMQIKMALGLYDTFLGEFLFGSGALGMGSIMYTTLYRGLPAAYAEAAYIDGAGEWRVFLNIYYPQSVPLMLIFVIQGAIGTWNDYMGPYLMLPTHPTLALGLHEMQQRFVHFGGDYPVMFAGLILAMAPVLIVYSIFADKIMGNTAMGALK